jgi:glycosyltransferase involved in cell wall biosynthesis
MSSFDSSLSNRPKLCIGMPIYNAASFLHKKLDSLLSQTFTDFEIIISDNASTDTTPKICDEYLKKDKRIHYFRQEKNMGVTWNFNFVLQQAKSEYFSWTAADDITLPDFLERNINILESKKNVVASISKIQPYKLKSENIPINAIDSKLRNFIKKLRKSFKDMGVYPIHGTYEDKVRIYLKKSTCEIIYGVFRTEKLQHSMIDRSFVGNDWATLLNVLKYGDFNVIDEVLMYEFESGLTSGGIINSARHYNHNLLGMIFPWYPLTFWCAKNLGSRIFLKNIDFFLQLNLEGIISLSVDLIRLFLHKVLRR